MTSRHDQPLSDQGPSTTSAGGKPSQTWHEGEIALQRSLGVVEKMEDVGRRLVRGYLTEEHRDFYRQLRWVAMGSVDADGDVWATLRAGPPGFLSAPDQTRVHVSLGHDVSDPAQSGLANGKGIGLLGIELHSRRRNRLNGSVANIDHEGFDVIVEQSFGNCPRFIYLRESQWIDESQALDAILRAAQHVLDADARELIEAADTFFVASYVNLADGRHQVDVSHKAGRPGFVRVDPDGVLTIPDFGGNGYFNTLGNLLVNPRAGLTFVNFATGTLLQMAGEAKVILDSPEIAAFEGAERLWKFIPTKILVRPGALPLRWRLVKDGTQPATASTGTWNEVTARLGLSADPPGIFEPPDTEGAV